MTEYFDALGNSLNDNGDFYEAYSMDVHRHAFGEDSRFVDAPDPDTEPDPACEGMRWEDIEYEIWEYERETALYEEEWRRMQAKGF